MKRIIFLDIDGVLASVSFMGRGVGSIDPDKCMLLNQLADIDAEVVISSSWGYDDGKTEQTLRECGLTLPIIGYTNHYRESWICRGNEIEQWLIENCGGIGSKYGYDKSGTPYYRKYPIVDYEFVIFDDDTDFLLGQKDHIIRIDENTGITQEDIDNARKILTRDGN